MPHPERGHELMIEVARLRRELEEARALAEKWALREAAGVERGIRADADALSEVQGLQATVERLRGDLVKYGSHVDECNGDDFCSCGLEVARLQAARAVNAEAECAHLAALRAEQDAELVSTREALAAARRECEGLRAALEKAAYGLRYGEAADLSITTATMRIEAWRGIRDAYYAARAALAAPGDGEEGKR